MNRMLGPEADPDAVAVSRVADRIGLLSKAGLAHLGVPSADLASLRRHADAESGVVYYTTSRAPLSAKRFRRAYATEQAVFRSDAERRLIPEHDLREVIGHIPHLAALWHAIVPVCVFDRAQEKGRLLIVRAGTARSLQAAVRELDQYVASDAFRPWWHFMDSQQNGLLYLYQGPDWEVTELQRWLDHRPPLATCGRPAIETPVAVEAAAAPSPPLTRSPTQPAAR